ncbi:MULTISPECIES: methylated-DNA--[protein]-cysteine S-methyltransferase [Sphingobacterium]|uniref:methylated-DNA--[protein]-cysteine S-methyltransferase n=1 Tax=Sphingobacterium TaxID=28453 RepID=UPI0013E49BAF|nr:MULTISPECIES: methylated-DNA--[protein]-cysteine S-methyltransferase [Sphingobacterium]QIH32448.1 methylated-DNA--[protein]-cysteine S-methyltransferase [Sphingobacterium sp. DR205]
MTIQQEVDFQRIAKAIHFLQENFRTQPTLGQIASHVYMSEAHFQRMFTSWAGTSPKKFLQYISLNHAKSLLKENNIAETTFQLGLSSSSRLHELFINIEGMTPAEYKNEGANLLISYHYYETLFGPIIIASTSKGICHIAYEEDKDAALKTLQKRFRNAKFIQQGDIMHENALKALNPQDNDIGQVKLHLKGTEFQLKVWEALLKIPMGNLSTYGSIASQIGNPKASRAVGTAVGSNPIAYLIPCHRVIQNSGIFGGYRWDPMRKTAMIGWESLHAAI